MFHRILIANRGEIACRVAATARRMGVRTVAVYSDADASARHVDACDQSIAIGAAAARDSYLRGDKIIAAALATGAQAIHPGYGFLSENAGFAQGCADAGLVFIGPPASAIEAMGSKSAAKTLMEKAGVPLVPGYHGDSQDAALLQSEADRIGYPVLLKASAGGGGKGMRVVEQSADFAAALISCKREAISSFGDDKVLIEKYLMRPRHVEIQVFADTLGNCVYLFERDCSVQRRHQKVLEEAPAPGLSEQRRAAMGAAAVAAARAVGYVGAGTVEFIVENKPEAEGGAFYFMEMNTRLQVEHPVTEMITGLDLVEWQLRVASGEPLPLQQHELRIQGHAIEARIYAENPEKGFLPAIGTLHHMRTPAAVQFAVNAAMALTGAGAIAAASPPAPVRIDSGFGEGDAITPFYDPMIAKLIVWGVDRNAALANMAAALAAYRVVGLSTNIAFLQRLIGGAAFSGADLDTGLIERHHAALFPPSAAAPLPVLALAAAALLREENRRRTAAANAPDVPAAPAAPAARLGDPWSATDGWRLHDRLQRVLLWRDDERQYRLLAAYRDGHWLLTQTAGDAGNDSGSASAATTDSNTDAVFEGSTVALRLLPEHGSQSDPRRTEGADNIHIVLDHQFVSGSVIVEGLTTHVFNANGHFTLRYDDPMAHAGAAEAETGRLTAPMPGKIVALLVALGDVVEKGAPLLVMEAMKMEHTIAAPTAGKVEQLHYAVGDQVAEGAALLSLAAVAEAQAA